MEEIKIQIEVIEAEMLTLENRIDDYSNYGRSPNKKDRFDQIRLLSEWRDYNNQLMALKEVLDAILSNLKYTTSEGSLD